MNTKTFAQQSRNLLMDGVAKKLLYWGFNTDGSVLESPQKVSGGYSFRGEPFDDPNVPQLWESLKKAVQNKGIDVVVEEAAYTWFNRMMALRIMVKNGYEQAQLEDAEGLEHTPIILQKARQGQYNFLSKEEQIRLKKIIGDYSKDQEAFALLLVGYCHSNKMLNRVFGKIDDYTELLLPDNMLQQSGFLHLLNTTDAISDAEYKEVELIGWLYQFYISEKKDDVFASFKKGKKAEAKDIPAATQIFTPNWIVKYMVQNTVGKIWLDKKPKSAVKATMKYLVENESDTAVSSSAQHIENKPIINEITDLTLIDPAVGSGHILVEGFDLLYQMYIEEYYTPEEAVESILKNNLFGLDIDERATQLATFAILLKAAKQYRDVFAKGWLPNVYCFPEDTLTNWFSKKNYAKKENWYHLQGMKLAQPVTIVWEENIKNKLVEKVVAFKKGDILNESVVDLLDLHHQGEITIDYSQQLELFWGDFDKPYNYNEFHYAINLLRQGKNLGSVIKFNISDEVYFHIKETYQNWLLKEQTAQLDFEEIAVFNQLKPYLQIFFILRKKYTAVAANPPYMGKRNMNKNLKDYLFSFYPNSKMDLMTVFMEKSIELSLDKGLTGMINLPSWMFLSSFEELRKSIISNCTVISLIENGRGIFGSDFGSVAFILMNKSIPNYKGKYKKLFDQNEKGKVENATKKNANFFDPNYPSFYFNQNNYLKIPGSPIAFWASDKVVDIFENKKLIDYSTLFQGIITGNNDKFVRNWVEVSKNNLALSQSSIDEIDFKRNYWLPYNKGGESRRWYGNQDYVVNFSKKGRDFTRGKHQFSEFFLQPCFSWTYLSISSLATRYFPQGFLWDVHGSSLFPNNKNHLKYFLSLIASAVGWRLLNILNPTISFQVENIAAVPVLLGKDEQIEKVNQITSNAIDITRKDWNKNETSWDFEKSPLLNASNSLNQAYQTWQEQVTQDFFQLHTNEEELNRIFIDIYGLQDELTPEVSLKEITILQEELSKKDLEKLDIVFRKKGAAAIDLPINKAEVISQFISYAIGLFMGRYRLNKPGLNIAHPNPTAEELLGYTYNNGKVTIDEDAIIPLMGLNCNFPDDALQQISQLLDTIWGANKRTENINFIQEFLNKDLEKFIVNDFYNYHCSRYNKKPIYWLFASPKGTFQVLVYMHRMNAFTVEKIRANYLLEHLKNLRSEESLLIANESNLNTQEAKRLDQLRKDITECETYDMELKNVADQQIVFDLDDGVTENYKLFETVVAKIK